MPKRIDLTGKRFGSLRVIGESGRSNDGKITWECACDCGEYRVISGGSLRAGLSKSCGHIRVDMLRERITTHGGRHRREYTSWKEMRQRCLNDKSPNYKYYGARGITICTEWVDDFNKFLEDMGPKPMGRGFSVDRMNVNDNYCPENCRWANYTEQTRNRRITTQGTYQGVTKPLATWAEELRVRLATLRIYVFDKGYTIAKALPLIESRRKIPYRKEKYS